MPSSDPIGMLLAHNRWANERLLDACAPLSREQFHQPFDIGMGSLHNTIAHIAGAMMGWSDMLAQREIRPRPESIPDHTVDSLREKLAAASDDLDASAQVHPVGEIVSGMRGGRSYSFTRGAVLTHVTTHGFHHRAQCLNMLRRLGAQPPDLSILVWTMTVDAPEMFA